MPLRFTIQFVLLLCCIWSAHYTYAQNSKRIVLEHAIQSRSSGMEQSEQVKEEQQSHTLMYAPEVKRKEAAPEKKPVPLEKSLLWEISGNGLQKPSYLFGTIHKICIEDFFWYPYMQTAFDNTEELVMEINMEEFENLYGVGGKDFEKKYYGLEGLDNDSLVYMMFDSISNQVNADLEEPETTVTVNEYEPPVYSPVKKKADTNINNLLWEPVFNKRYSVPVIKEEEVPAVYAIEEAPTAADYDNLNGTNEYAETYCEVTVSYESKLTANAQADDKKISGLETIGEQMQLVEMMYKNISDNMDIENDIWQHLAADDNQPLSFNDLAACYQKQDIDQLLQLMTASKFDRINLDIMLFARNEKWMEQIPGLMTQSPKFIAVGAGHLPGVRGLINLLRLKGYTVKPILK